MKALLYKDACVLWKQMKFMLVIIAVFCLLPNSFGLNAFFVVYPGLMLPVSLMAYDERAHWDSFAAMLPYPPRALVLSRYAAGWLLTLLAGVLYLVGALIQDQGVPLGTALGTLGWVLAVVLLCQAILFPFFFRVGTEQGRLYMILLSVLLLLGGRRPDQPAERGGAGGVHPADAGPGGAGGGVGGLPGLGAGGGGAVCQADVVSLGKIMLDKPRVLV